MSTLADRNESGGLAALAAPLQFVWSAWQAMTRRQWATAGAIALAVMAFGSLTTIEQTLKMEWDALVIGNVVAPLLSTLLFVLAWAVAAAGDDRRTARPWRMALAVLVASIACGLLAVEFAQATGAMDWMREFFTKKGRPVPGRATILFVESLNALVVGGLVVAVTEVNLHRARIQRAVEHAAREQSAIARELLESRLAAMQAQVEPQFLFDSLVDVQALYARDTQHGAAILDRLIAYLRVALPRLREAGSNVFTEVELVRAYLDVVAARHDGRPQAAFAIAPDAECERFYPMLLLPLVQRAVRVALARSGTPPADIALRVEVVDGALQATLDACADNLCDDDADIMRVRERLAGLTESRATLACTTDGNRSRFTLRLPPPLSVEPRLVEPATDASHRDRR